MKNIIEADYDRLAKDYDKFMQDLYRLDLFLDNLPKNQGRVLDIGCGTGQLIEHLAIKFKKAYGIDVSAKMLSKAREKRIGNAEFFKGNSEVLNFPDQYFDFVVSANTLHHSNLDKSLGEIKRVLKKNGNLVILDIACNFRKPIIPICFIKRAYRCFNDVLEKGPKKAFSNFWYQVKFLRHMNHDKFMNKEEFVQAYKKRLNGCNIGNACNNFYYVLWRKK